MSNWGYKTTLLQLKIFFDSDEYMLDELEEYIDTMEMRELDSDDKIEVESILNKLLEKCQGEVICDECIESVFMQLGEDFQENESWISDICASPQFWIEKLDIFFKETKNDAEILNIDVADKKSTAKTNSKKLKRISRLFQRYARNIPPAALSVLVYFFLLE